MPDVYRKLDWLSKEDLIKRMVSHEFNRFLDYYRDREEIEITSTLDGGRKEKRNKGEKGVKGPRQAEEGYARLFINLGKSDNFFPADLISLLNNHTRGRIAVGRIDLMRNFSFFEVEEGAAKNVLKALNRASWRGRKVSVEVADAADKEPVKGEGKRKGSAKPARTATRAHEQKYSKKDDWKQFFQLGNEFRGPEPDFSEEGWAKRSKKKKK